MTPLSQSGRPIAHPYTESRAYQLKYAAATLATWLVMLFSKVKVGGAKLVDPGLKAPPSFKD